MSASPLTAEAMAEHNEMNVSSPEAKSGSPTAADGVSMKEDAQTTVTFKGMFEDDTSVAQASPAGGRKRSDSLTVADDDGDIDGPGDRNERQTLGGRSQMTATTYVGDDWDMSIDVEQSDVLGTWPEDRVEALTNALKTAPWHSHTHRLMKHNDVMSGEEISKWLKENNFARTDDETQTIGQSLFNRKMIFPISKKKEKHGFRDTAKHYYSLYEVDETVGGRFDRVSILPSLGGKKTVVTGVLFRKDEGMVIALIQERERKFGVEGFKAEHLGKSDPQQFSMAKEEVPVPSVGDATPETCEWIIDWEVEVSEETDKEGWRYAADFKEGSKTSASDEAGCSVRFREWARPARKILETANAGGKKRLAFDDDDDDEDGEKTEEQRQKDLLNRATEYAARQIREGFLEVTVICARDVPKQCDSQMFVDYRDTREKSEICKKAQQHKFDFKSSLTLQSDMEPIHFTLVQVNKFNKRVALGEADFYIPQHEVGGHKTLHLKVPRGGLDGGVEMAATATASPTAAGDGADASAAVATAASLGLGSIKIEWNFTVDENAANAAEEENADNALRRCIVSFNVESAKNLAVEKKRFGPCGLGSRSGSSSKLFLRLTYRGEYCDMVGVSNVYPYSSEPAFDWKTSVLLLPAAPVQIELCQGSVRNHNVLGKANVTIDMDNTEEQSVELPLTKPTIMTPAQMSSAESPNNGDLVVKWQCFPELDAFEELLQQGMTNAEILDAAASPTNMLTNW